MDKGFMFNNGFISYKYADFHFSRRIIDVFISCLDSHSDGTHSLQSIHCWESDVMLHFSKLDEETNSSTSWMDQGWVNIQQMFFFWGEFLLYPFKSFQTIFFYSLSKYLLDWSGLRSTHLRFTASTRVMNLSLCASVDVGVGFDHCLVFQDSSSVWFRAPWISIAGAGDFALRLCFWDIAELWQRCPKPHRF